MKTIAARFLALFVFLGVAFPAFAEEFIRSYHSVVEVAADGKLAVTETITARAEGQNIKRGIFRDFPLYALDANNRRTKVDFNVVSVERDGTPESWRTENIDGGIRIYTGSADRFLPTGEHVFQITYTTARQIRYFSDYDELTWNVTGNGWQFPMGEISATITLPQGVKATDTAVFTGPLGAKGKDARILNEGNEVFFASTRPFTVGEGMTVAVKLPKGAIAAPDTSQEAGWWLRDNLAILLSGGGLLAVLFYYLRAWFAVGRDPAKGVVVPRWDAPEGLSPALVNYVDNRGFSGAGWTALSASALDLAVKGYVVLEDLKNSIVIRRTEKAAAADLPTGQKTLLSSIGGPGETLTIDKAHGAEVEKVGKQFRAAIEKEHSGKYYHSNSGYIFFGIFFSIALIVATLVFGDLDEFAIAAVLVFGFFAFFFSILSIGIGRQFSRGASLRKRIGGIVMLAFAGFVAFSAIGGIATQILLDVTHDTKSLALAAIGGIVLTNALFLFLMGAPTPLGRKLMDGIEGLRTYLTLAEKDRMNMAAAPAMSPQHFETLLPYAVALGVEKPWSRTFETWLATAAAGAAVASYAPGWYLGSNYGSFGDRIGGFSTSMASTIASTIPQPVSSSNSSFSGGGGGGFSGSGGGGGGGGGW
ncbi:DUF2207 domain-containing protein [Agrobacterium genomosp. 3]|uniref:DUF2207 domain-containing protein n=1 Tax=Agrobacterium tomkonis TaxID=1183410 RepID=UPI001B452330|nr:DUF2207 domain-containing protein [Agrobacterium sp.]MCA1866970.1 DUF2207 domain-containing protein [Agrobacterium tomkonis]MCA1877322.1 DUF2207 domain-containing protein [Agrobacterium tumefaciens]MCA1890144.1 DUF2207 domain-containing protein [Agrobacterium tomkonis]